MRHQVEFFFDVGSPAAYLAWTQLPWLRAETGAEVIWRPMLLGGVFKATGNSPPGLIPAKRRYMHADLARHARQYDVPLRISPHFPHNTLTIMRGACAYLTEPDLERYLSTVFKAMWVTGADVGDPVVLARILKEAGFDTDDFDRQVTDPAVKQKLKDNTEEAVARGVFGAPTWFVGKEMFFGQDRIDFVRRALLG